MKMFTQWLIRTFLFGGTMFFAAGAPVVTGEGAGDVGDAGDIDGGTGDLGVDDGASDVATSAEDAALNEGGEHREPVKVETKEEPELGAFRGLVSKRLLNLKKEAPEISQVFQKYPKVQEQIEASFRREAAYRDAFPTVAEANQMRDAFPGGLADVQQLQSDVAETEALDKDFYGRDREGNYPGHSKIISNMFQDDREAAVSLCKNLPKEWARLDRDSYNEVMGAIVGSTLTARGIPEFVVDLIDAAKEAKQDSLAAGLTKLFKVVDSFTKEKPKPTADEERLNRDRSEFKRETAQRDREEGQRFHQSFISQSRKVQTDAVKAHPAVKRMLESKSLPEAKKAELVESVRKNVEQLLAKSTSFMRKLNPAYKSRNLTETLSLQKSAWSQQWLMNRMVRSVFQKEIPQLVQSNRESVRRRAGAPATRGPVKTGEEKRNQGPQGPKQIGGRWYRDGGKGAPFTTAEVLAGKHMQS